MSLIRRCPFVGLVWLLAVFALPRTATAQLTPNCTVSILNRTAPVNGNGNWSIDNVPTNLGLVRAHAVCTQNGQTTFGATQPRIIVPGQVSGFDPAIQLGSTDSTPAGIAITAPSLVLNQSGATVQLTVTATYVGGNTADVTSAASGTSYLTTNPGILTVTKDGLVTASTPGTAIISAVQDGATAFLSLQVFSPADTDGDGIPDDAEVSMGLNPNNPVDASEDLDGDGLSNLDEYRLHTDIRNADTDGDGIPDGIEVKLGLNPLVADPTTTVQGRVVDGAAHPVAGVTVTLFGQFTTITDATGAFSLRYIPAGTGNVVATATFLGVPAQTALSASVAPVAAGTTNLGTIQLAASSGSVTGTVVDSQSQAVSGAKVSIASGAMTLTATTDASGRYSVSNLLSGAVTVIAFDPVTGARGRATGTLAQGATFTINVQVGTSGSVTGVVYRSGGVTPAALTPVTLSSTGAAASTVTDVFGRYTFDVVPTGAVTVGVADSSTGDRGRATGTLTAAAGTVAVNVTFNGVGKVSVSVTSGSSPIANAPVTVTSQSQFGGSQSGVTGSNGVATFNQVLAGGVSVSATNPANNAVGTATGTVLVGLTANISIPFQAGPGTGSVTGRVLAPDGITAISGEAVKLLDVNNVLRQQMTSAADGSFRFDGAALGTYSLLALDATGRTQAHEVGVVIANGGDVVTRNLVLAATGTVSGRVLNPDSSVSPAIAVSLRSYNAVVGGFFSATTNAQGQYSIAGVPIGDFMVSAADTSRQVYGETSGLLTAGATFTADIPLAVNTSALPATKYDANNFTFDVNPDGSVGSGYHSVYSGAFLLDVLTGATANRFTGSPTGSTSLGGRQLAIQQQSLAQLTVTRKVYIPRDGYFARYLEILSNPTGAPITVGLRVTSNLSSSSLVQTSNGNSVLNVNSSTVPDRWIVLDDFLDEDPVNVFSMPSTAFGFDGSGAPERAVAASFDGRQLTYEWGGITVPAGGTVAYMHFGVQETVRSSAQTAVEHLRNLPPEALVGLSAAEIAQVRNFAIAPDGTSTLAPLPALTGAVNGVVYDFDGITPIPAAKVQLVSNNVFFNRTQTLTAGVAGAFSFHSNLNDTGTSMAIPLGPFSLSAQHPTTQVQSPLLSGGFPAGQTTLAQNISFTNTGTLRGTAAFASGATSSGSTVSIAGGGLRTQAINIAADGTFVAGGQHAGTYNLTLFLNHPQGGFVTGAGTAIVVAGQTTLVGNLLPPTGNVTGTVLNQDGTPAVNAIVSIGPGPGGLVRQTNTDPTGHYALTDLPGGNYPIFSVADYFGGGSFSNSGAQNVSVTVNQNITRNLQLTGLGSVQVTVKNGDGSFARGANVTLDTQIRYGNTSSGRQTSGTTDAAGQVTFTDIAVGTSTLRTTHPSYYWLAASSTVVLAAPGSTAAVTMTFASTGTITGKVTNPDGTAAAGATVAVSDAPAFLLPYTTTDSNGNYTVSQVPINRPMQVAAFTSSAATYHQGVVNNNIIPAAGGTITVNVSFDVSADFKITVTRGGAPVNNSFVEIAAQGSPFNQGQPTDASGVVTYTGFPTGTYIFRAHDPANFAIILGTATGTITAADDGHIINVAIVAGTQISGTVQGTIFAGDGVTPVPNAEYSVYDLATGQSVMSCGELCFSGTDQNGFYQVQGVSFGSLGFKVIASLGPVTVQSTGTLTSAGQIVTVNLTLPVSVVKGTVFRSNGTTPVPFPNVFGLQGDNSYFGASDENGFFSLFGIALGPFTITAQNPDSILTGTAAGTVTSVTAPLALNILIQPSGSFAGRVVDGSGATVSQADVGGSTEGGNFNFLTSADPQGNYRFDQVPLGNLFLQAADPSSGVSATGFGSLASDGQTTTVNFNLPSTGAVQGRVLTADGVTAASNADVSVQSFASVGPLGTVKRFASADAGGNYQVGGVPNGALRVTGDDPNNPASVGLADGVLTPPGPLFLNPRYGNAVRLGLVNLDGADGFRYDVDCWGGLNDGGTADRRLRAAYASSFVAQLLGTSYSTLVPCLNTGALDLNGRQITVGPSSATTGLSVSRKIFVPTAGKYARYLEVLSNPTPAPITVDLQIYGTLGSSDKTRLVTDPATTSNQYAVTDANGVCCYPTLGYVFAGPGAATPATFATFATASPYYYYGWHLTIPAGRTAILMHFAVQRDITDAAGANAMAQALVNLTDPDALTGLGQADKALILNFRVQ